MSASSWDEFRWLTTLATDIASGAFHHSFVVSRRNLDFHKNLLSKEVDQV